MVVWHRDCPADQAGCGLRLVLCPAWVGQSDWRQLSADSGWCFVILFLMAVHWETWSVTGSLVRDLLG